MENRRKPEHNGGKARKEVDFTRTEVRVFIVCSSNSTSRQFIYLAFA